MNIDKYKHLTLDEYNKIISQENIIQTEKEITNKGITYTLNDDGYFNITCAKTVRGYDKDYSGAGKNAEETESINRGIVLAIQSVMSIIDESEHDFDVFIEKSSHNI